MKKKDRLILFAILVVVVLVIGSYIINFYSANISGDSSNWGNLGSYIGGTLSIVSVLLIYYTYRKQSEMNYRSQFESIFFKMLDRQRKIYNDIDGCNLFRKMRDKIKTHFPASFEYELNRDEAYLLFANYFGYHISSNKHSLHYFRHLYQIVKYIHTDNLMSDLNKKKYIGLIQAEMSDDELFVSLFNTVWWDSNFKREDSALQWLDNYSFYENLQSSGEWFDTCKKRLFPNTKWKHNTPKFKIDDIDLEDKYEEESWSETLKRLKL